jgi:hypothetical protein
VFPDELHLKHARCTLANPFVSSVYWYYLQDLLVSSMKVLHRILFYVDFACDL